MIIQVILGLAHINEHNFLHSKFMKLCISYKFIRDKQIQISGVYTLESTNNRNKIIDKIHIIIINKQ